MESEFQVDRRFDLAVCLEVVEHLKESSADCIVKNLTSLSDIIVFSASIPGQKGGQYHVNEQWPDYWIEKFKKYGYSFHDVFRPILWDNKKISRWYKQNMFLVLKNGKENIAKDFEKYVEKRIFNYVHPEYYNLRVREIDDVLERNQKLYEQVNELLDGSASLFVYFKVFIKYLLRKLGIYRKQCIHD
ncbi:hypothetical protein ACFL1N_13820 [Thermodesulfobacteriota bacterium]